MSQQDPFREIEQLFDQLTDFGPGAMTGSGSVPVDVIDAGEAIEVRADLPGYETDDIEVQLHEGRRLTIAAEATESTEHQEDQFVTRERSQRATSRTVTLPEPVDDSGTEASYASGVLTVRLPKRSPDEGTDIPVN